MKMRLVVATAIFCMLLMPSIVSAHDQKEYNILITEDGLTPSSINPGILVETDTLFFRNVDDRQDVQHQILVDADGDGIFEGIDDFSTEWISSSCELNETGEKVDEDCNQHALIPLEPSNKLLPGNISMIHRVKENNQTIDVNFYINYSPDAHMADENAPTGETDNEGEITEKTSKEQILEMIMFVSFLAVIFVGIELIKPDEN
ncbi:MAG: hypothetical protein NLN66_01135 [Candidatus Thalassarchaeaceae archaeon]|nr:hypothetical protein [Candidatus Thalassarchaeaceae archaeon]